LDLFGKLLQVVYEYRLEDFRERMIVKISRRATSLALLAIMFATAGVSMPATAAQQTILAARVLDVEAGVLRPASLIRVDEGLIVEIVPAEGAVLPKDLVDLSDLRSSGRQSRQPSAAIVDQGG
jgi:hypothetical protein